MICRKIAFLLALLLCCSLLAGCGGNEKAVPTPAAAQEAEASAPEQSEPASPEATEAPAVEDAEPAVNSSGLADGTYSAKFDTDSSMFHVNEACEGRGTLTVKDGEMTIHISLASQKILNLYYGLAEDAKKEGAALLEPTLDTVTYEDGMTDEVFGFDVPVPAIDEEFDCALVGTKGTWYDHKVIVSDPQPIE